METKTVEVPYTEFKKLVEADTTVEMIKRMLMTDAYVSTSDIRTVLGIRKPEKVEAHADEF